MLFNSYTFIFAFLPVTFIMYHVLAKSRYVISSKIFLVLASLFFYSWWNVSYLPILVFSLLFNFYIGEILQKYNDQSRRKATLIFGVVINVVILGYYKYADFLVENINNVAGSDFEKLNLLLPLAISFFTFQQIAYLVDCYKRSVKEYDFLNYSLFVTFFPQLIAGPIVHHSEMMPQFMRDSREHRINYENIAAGLFIFSIGLFKKVIIADTFAVVATNGFDYAETLNIFEAWITSLSYTFQLYFDFSGYTDMAIGAAFLFNIKLPENFNSPYKAVNIQDFWRRWHITLSRFLRDYIYIPLGGKRSGSAVTYRNIVITFLIGGIWHGAGWTFVIWGALHAIAMVVHGVWVKAGFHLNRYIAWFVTFNFINVSWVFFRASDYVTAKKILISMFSGDVVLDYHWKESASQLGVKNITFGPWLQNIYAENKVFLYIVVSLLVVTMFKNSNELVEDVRYSKWTALVVSVIFVAAVLNMSKISEFLYFNF